MSIRQLLFPPDWEVVSSISAHSPAAELGAVTWGTSAGWPIANRIWYIPVSIAAPMTAKKMFWLNGSVASGNVDVGIMDAPGARLINSGSTAQGTISVVQVVDITDTLLPTAGTYYIALTMDNTTGRMWRTNSVSATTMNTSGIMFETPGSFGIPTTATFTATGSSFYPLFGFAGTTLI